MSFHALLVMLLLFTATAQHPQPTARHTAVIRAFERQSGYPHGRRGYVVDHQIPLCAGGPDSISNLQWQPKAIAARKDGFERALCHALAAQGYHIAKDDPLRATR